LKQHGKTTTEENYTVEKMFWKDFLATSELDEHILKSFMHNTKLLNNFLSLIDMRNYNKQDNLSSIKHQEKVELVNHLLFGLGFSSAVDDAAVGREDFATNFICNLCNNPAFKNRKPINELFELRKETTVNENMDTKQMLIWVISLLKQFSLSVRAIDCQGRGYHLEVLNDVLGDYPEKEQESSTRIRTTCSNKRSRTCS